MVGLIVSRGSYPSHIFMSQLQKSGCFAPCLKCGVNRMQVDNLGNFVDPHNMCLQCLGKDHDPTLCPICSQMS
jgi:hypothetical protein